jgi:butirosin biosynthesis protein H-like
MTILAEYNEFEGLHWETGTLRNILAYQGVRHNGKPLSEALLMGISGGIAAGYFTFEYEDMDPWLHFLTLFLYNGAPGRVYERLNISKQVKQTDKPEKAVAHLLAALDAGKPALVWADMFSLPYNNLKSSEIAWGMFPVVVYGYDEPANRVHIADRSCAPLTTTTDEFATARARVRSDKHRLITVGTPDLGMLPEAIKAGIEECVSSFLDDPPKAPMKGKYGLDAFKRWANLLVDKKGGRSSSRRGLRCTPF